jgi:hypothetical protein
MKQLMTDLAEGAISVATFYLEAKMQGYSEVEIRLALDIVE